MARLALQLQSLLPLAAIGDAHLVDCQADRPGLWVCLIAVLKRNKNARPGTPPTLCVDSLGKALQKATHPRHSTPLHVASVLIHRAHLAALGRLISCFFFAQGSCLSQGKRLLAFRLGECCSLFSWCVSSLTAVSDSGRWKLLVRCGAAAEETPRTGTSIRLLLPALAQ